MLNVEPIQDSVKHIYFFQCLDVAQIPDTFAVCAYSLSGLLSFWYHLGGKHSLIPILPQL